MEPTPPSRQWWRRRAWIGRTCCCRGASSASSRWVLSGGVLMLSRGVLMLSRGVTGRLPVEAQRCAWWHFVSALCASGIARVVGMRRLGTAAIFLRRRVASCIPAGCGQAHHHPDCCGAGARRTVGCVLAAGQPPRGIHPVSVDASPGERGHSNLPWAAVSCRPDGCVAVCSISLPIPCVLIG